ncbi:MAG TPA: FHA domain-containing protein [Thermoleophilia bacterium]|nr:FHA domain-containing protein [Thermoleophilia bacterium]
MLDVVLLVLKIAFIVLLFLFVYLVVRRAGRDVAGQQPRQAPPAPSRAAAPAAAPAPAPAPVAAAAMVPESTPAERRRRRERRHAERTQAGESLDLLAHIDPRLVVVSSPVLAPGTEVRLDGWIMIGRSPTSDLVLDDPYVSQTHARVVPRGQLHFVEDLGSTNGTFVNGREVVEGQLLLDAELRVGETVFRYEE